MHYKFVLVAYFLTLSCFYNSTVSPSNFVIYSILRKSVKDRECLYEVFNFLTGCRKFNLSPKGFLSKSRISTTKSNQMEFRFSRIRMREMLNTLHAKLFLLDLDIKAYPNKETYKLSLLHLKKMREGIFYKDEDIQQKKIQYDGKTARQDTS